MFPPNHKVYIRALYKNILVEASLFFDDRARLYIQNRARKVVQEYKTCTDVERVKYKIREARKHLHRIEQANRGDQKSALKILEEVYGRNGKTRHALLHPFLNCHQPKDFKLPEPFVPHAPRTAPPPLLCPPLQALIKQDLGKKLEPELPIPAYKPLHPGRKANLLWKHRSMLLDRVQLPLPFEIICEIERKAGATVGHALYAGTLLTGGPTWDFYLSTDTMTHLNPTIKLPKRSTLNRNHQTLMDSPYATITNISLVDHVKKVKRPFNFPTRTKSRLYRRLLTNIPFTNIISPTTLWTQSCKILKSHWVPQGVTRILEDIPSEQVIKTTLKIK
ncbi:uncharacterized protein EV154DRAFT_607084 [Mucor mucedo]|uniref:uncharacterized protein n=1 Tax=Mucor mucedo TaxID=29922 RepID=UPI0022206982|nr:uncharacterized protein EV154DRAFT_607084 [Mucor mucedo]KAI7873699.1 hypothetical protein EV154DRAFT_607084 [Mucor mucedo]